MTSKGVIESSRWRGPVVMASLTLAGLGIALVDGNQPWRGIAWALLTVPIIVAVMAWSGLWSRRKGYKGV